MEVKMIDVQRSFKGVGVVNSSTIKPDFDAIVEEVGHAKDEFEVSEAEDPSRSDGFCYFRGTVTVRNTRSDVERAYGAGHGTTWLADFKRDLIAGLFERPN